MRALLVLAAFALLAAPAALAAPDSGSCTVGYNDQGGTQQLGAACGNCLFGGEAWERATVHGFLCF